jgi:hypothetical protein
MHAPRPVLGDLRGYCCDDCERARRALAQATTPQLELPGGAAYLAVKAMLRKVTADGEADARRLHGPDLARRQLAEARAERGTDLDAWLAAAAARPPAARQR